MRKRSRDRHDKGNEGYEQGLEDDQEEEQEEEEQEKWTSYARADDWIDALVFVTGTNCSREEKIWWFAFLC